jgi:hypothetical protein
MLGSAPTDNLYKFVTFIGIATLLGSFWLARDSSVHLDDALGRYYSAKNSWNFSQTALEEGLAATASDLERYQKVIAEAKTPDDVARAQALYSEIISTFRALQGIRTESKKADAEATTQGEILDRVLARAKEDQWFAWMGMLVGSLFSYFGFRLWYFKHQMFQDDLLKAQIPAPKNDTPTVPHGPSSKEIKATKTVQSR